MKVQLLLQRKNLVVKFHQWWQVMKFVFNENFIFFEKHLLHSIHTQLVSCTHIKAPKWHFKKGHCPHQSDMPPFIDPMTATEKCKKINVSN